MLLYISRSILVTNLDPPSQKQGVRDPYFNCLCTVLWRWNLDAECTKGHSVELDFAPRLASNPDPPKPRATVKKWFSICCTPTIPETNNTQKQIQSCIKSFRPLSKSHKSCPLVSVPSIYAQNDNLWNILWNILCKTPDNVYCSPWRK